MNSSKKIFGVLVGVLVFLACIVEVKGIEITTDEIDNLENNEINLKPFEELKISNEENNIHNCSASNSDLFDVYNDGFSCTITPTNYGKGYIDVWTINPEGGYDSKKFYINVELEKYMNDVVARFPNSFDTFNYDFSKYLPDNVWASKDWQCDLNQSQFCDVTFYYNYSTTSDIPGHVSPYTQVKQVEFINDRILTGSITLTPNNNTWQLQLNNYYGSYNDLIFVSSDNSIVTVDQKGKITGVNPGVTTVKVYNKNDFNSDEVTVFVSKEKTLSPSDLYNLYNNKEINVTINNDIYLSFDEDNKVSYYNIIFDFFSKKFSNEINSYYYSYQGIQNLNCTDNLCSFDLNYYSYGQTNTLVFSNVSINLEGIYLNPNFVMEFDSLYILDYRLFNNVSEDDITVMYDKSYFVDNLNGTYTPIKSGKTQIIVTGGGYEIIQDVYVIYPYSENEEISSYLNDISAMTLPYNELAFTNYQNLDILEQIVENKIIREYPDEEIRDLLTTDVYCFSANNCQVKLNIDMDGHILLGSISLKLITINYSGYSQNLINDLSNINSQIFDKYNFDNSDTLKTYDACLGDATCLFDELIKKTNISNLSTDELSVKYELIDTINLVNEVPLAAHYKISINNNDLLLFSKDITIYANPIIDMDMLIDSNEKENYLKEYIDSILNSNVSILNLYDNIYQITNNDYTFNVLLDKKEVTNITSVSVSERLFELNVNDTEKINYTIYPTGANNGNVTFKSDDEEIATVSPEGIITAHKKGYTFIEISVGYSSQKVLVVVDMDTKDVFNEILGVVSSHQVIDYYSIIVNSQYSEDPLADAIRNNISNELYGEGYHIFSVEVAKEEDEYYIRISMYNEDVYSDYLKITYELKGIHVSNRNYYIADGETIDTDLFFTEGDNLNLYVSIEDETVASYDTTGKLIGLKTGVTGVNVSDKYNNYHVYFKVYVNYDEYVSNLQKEITSQPLEVDYIKFTQNNRYYDSVVSSVLNFTYDLYNLNNTSTHYDCDEENNVCDFIFKQNDETIMEFTIDVNLVGIKLPEKEVYLNKDEMKDINYELLNDDSNVIVTSLDEEVCIVEDNKIKGISSGFCTVKYESDKYINYQHIIVEKDEIVRVSQEKLNNMPNNMEMPIKNFDLNNTNSLNNYDNGIDLIKNAYVSYLQKSASDYLDAPWEIGTGISNIEDNNLINTTTVSISAVPQYSFVDFDNNYNYYIELRDENITKDIEVTPVNADASYIELGNKITQIIEYPYYLSLKQYLIFELNGGNQMDLIHYSSFQEDLYNICPTCEIGPGQGGMGDADVGYVMSGQEYLITNEGVPVGYYYVEVIADMSVIQEDAVLSEDEFIELIEETVKEEYIAAKEELEISRVARMANTLSNEDDIYVNVEKVFDATIPNLYDITVEDINFQTVVNTTVVGEEQYTYSVTDIIFSESAITLNVGESKIIGYTIVPDNATNKDILWESSNPSIVSVDASGAIIARSPGNATITVKSKDGNTTKTINVTVNASETPEIEVTLGDINLDGAINMTDLIKLRKYFAGLETLDERALKNADINKDGTVNMTDIIKLRKYFAGLEDLK